MIESIKSPTMSAYLQFSSREEKASNTQSKSKVQFQNTSKDENLFHRGLRILKASIDFEFDAKIPNKEDLYEKLKTYGSFEELRQNEYTPEKVSGRILSHIKGSFATYQKQNPKLSETEAIAKYSDIMKKSVDQGFKKAMDVLGEIPEDIESELQKSIDLVHDGIQEFKESYTGIN